MSFQSKDSLVLGTQLKVQRLVCKKSDPMVSTSGNNATIDVKEPVSEVRFAMLMDDSANTGAGGLVPINAAGQTISGTTITLALGVALATADVIIVEYVLDPTQS